ncbi:MAG: flagellar biosynthetic protein FlhB [Pseudomonadota bacterium]|jgi:flagellar biosynthetic protein FlhB
MADPQDQSQKTEEPTQRKLDEARRKGDVPVSRDVHTLALVLAVIVLVGGLGPGLARDMAGLLLPFVENAPGMVLATPADAMAVVGWLLGGVGLVLLAPVGLLLGAALAAAIGQGNLLVAGERIRPKLDRISPIQGVKRLFSLKALVEWLKGLAKVAAITAALVVVLGAELPRAEAMALADAAAIGPLLVDISLRLLLAVLVAALAIALVDLVWQRLSWRRQQRMTLQEVKDEFRQAEGDPHLKARIKQLRRDRARRRMFQEIPTATVVITNPTHVAVALRYDLTRAPAPVCVAKGLDLVALRIRETAGKHNVPIVENPPLARTLHAAVEVGEEVTPDHYLAVAEVISYVVGLTARDGRL